MQEFSQKKGNVDHVLLLAIVALVVFGLIMITSVGVPKSISLSKAPGELFPNCGVSGVDCYFLLKRHAMRVLVGLIAFFLGSKISYSFWKKLAIPLFFGTVILLIMVFIFGSANNTAARSWFNIYGSSIQPAEIAKLVIIFYLATWLERKGKEIKDFKNGFLSFLIVALLMILPVLLQPDLGATLVLATIAASIYFVAGAAFRHIALGLLFVGLFMLIIVPLTPYLRYRFLAFMNPSPEICQPANAEGAVTRNYCWQVEQANIAVGSGGFFGKGLTQGIQKSYWLPQTTDDFIFAASAEELGFVRIMFVVFAYIVIMYRGFVIATRAPDYFSQLLATGITSWIVFQAFINIAVNIGLMPVTGITLPFVSYGGSSMVTTLLAAGILLNISRHVTPYEISIFRGRDRGTHSAKSRGYSRARQ